MNVSSPKSRVLELPRTLERMTGIAVLTLPFVSSWEVLGHTSRGNTIRTRIWRIRARTAGKTTRPKPMLMAAALLRKRGQPLLLLFSAETVGKATSVETENDTGHSRRLVDYPKGRSADYLRPPSGIPSRHDIPTLAALLPFWTRFDSRS